MNTIDRREFIGTAIIPLLASFGGNRKNKLKLAFNTLACPNWNLKTAILNASKMGYHGIEIRGIAGDLNLTDAPELKPGQLPEIIKICREENVKIINLNASAVLHEYEPIKRQKNLDEARAYIELAQKLDCPYVRMFPDKFPPEKSREFGLETMRENYGKALEFCKGTRVSILLDAHGDLVQSDDILSILNFFPDNHSGTIWDFFNMHLKTGESAKDMVEKLYKYIRIVQIKDGRFLPNQKYEYTLTGMGEVNITENLKQVLARGYKGFVSFEWEKRWHPELPDPEIALPDFVRKINKIVKS